MIRRSFIGFTAPKLYYNLETTPVQELPLPKRVVLMLKESGTSRSDEGFQAGDAVKTGQRLARRPESSDYVIASVTGNITGIAPYVDGYGQTYTAITIEAQGTDEWDSEFDRGKTPEAALKFLQYLPGMPSLQGLKDPDRKIKTLVVMGIDEDLLLTTNQQVIQDQSEEVKNGLEVLKRIAGFDQALVIVPESLVQQGRATGGDVKTISPVYPNSLPQLVMKNIMGKMLDEGDTPEDEGVLFISAEAVAAVGVAYETGKLPVTKILTVVAKDGSAKTVKARIGTSIKEVLQACNIPLSDRDRLVSGGPMRGAATYSENLPVEPGTNGIAVQAQADSAQVTDYPCVNCGECVRVCPVNIPVNMLVRFLEAGLYDEARALYELDCCIECGLCSYVCISRIPIFQYIKLGKYELNLMDIAEAENE